MSYPQPLEMAHRRCQSQDHPVKRTGEVLEAEHGSDQKHNEWGLIAGEPHSRLASFLRKELGVLQSAAKILSRRQTKLGR